MRNRTYMSTHRNRQKKKGSGRNEHQRICLRKESDESEAELK